MVPAWEIRRRSAARDVDMERILSTHAEGPGRETEERHLNKLKLSDLKTDLPHIYIIQ